MSTAKRVLVVDDQSLIRKVLRMSLTKIGYENVVEACNGVEAQQAVDEHHPDLIICDINMSPLDGLEFLRGLRKSKGKIAHIPVIFLTCNDDLSLVDEANAAGANGYLIKPVMSTDLIAEVNRVLSAQTDVPLYHE